MDPNVISVDVCPRCRSPFDTRVHRIVLCPECSQECCTAGCMPMAEDDICPECQERGEEAGPCDLS